MYLSIGGRDEEAAVLARVAGQVGAAAAEGEAHGRAGDDHGGLAS